MMKTKAVQKLASNVMWFASKEHQDIEIAYSKKDNVLKGELQEYFLDLSADLIGEFGYQCDIQMTRSYFRKSDPSGFTWKIVTQDLGLLLFSGGKIMQKNLVQ